jgi:NADPH-dependent ferric siderophore reductase
VPDGTACSPDDADAPRPPSRTYTPLRYDASARTLDVEFVHHGDGLAAIWAQNASVGNELYLAGPGGGYEIAQDISEIVLVADDTALPAASTILGSLPESCRVTTIFEVANVEEERDLGSTVDVSTTWIHRNDRNGAPGDALLNAVRSLAEVTSSAQWWIACEANAMRRIRDHLLTERGVDAALAHTRGYWRLGETNYPDHDYGDD